MNEAEEVVVCLEQRRRKNKRNSVPYKQSLVFDGVVKVKVPKAIKPLKTKTMTLYEYYCPVMNGEVQVLMRSKLPLREIANQERCFKARILRRAFHNGHVTMLIYLFSSGGRTSKKELRVVSGKPADKALNRQIIRLPWPLEGDIIITDEGYSADIVPLFAEKGE